MAGTGHGTVAEIAQQHRQWYSRPTQTGSTVRHIGKGFHINWLPAEELHLVEIDADHWKTWVHQRLTTPLGSVGALSFYQAPLHEHLALAKHLTAERKIEEFVAGKGVVVKWERLRRRNHWFNALYNASAAAHFCGVRLVDEPEEPPPPPPPPGVFRSAAARTAGCGLMPRGGGNGWGCFTSRRLSSINVTDARSAAVIHVKGRAISPSHRPIGL